jgi:hypothetical protein
MGKANPLIHHLHCQNQWFLDLVLTPNNDPEQPATDPETHMADICWEGGVELMNYLLLQAVPINKN